MIEKKTKIVCTIGPSSSSKEVMLKLLQAGMNVARFNFSHGSYEEHGEKLNSIRELEASQNVIIPVMLDTKGPEIRTHLFEGDQASIETGDVIKIYMTEVLGNKHQFSVTYAGLFDDVKVGDSIRLDDGNLGLQVIEKDEKNKVIVTKALNHHIIKNRRGVNCPETHLTLPYISEKDFNDLVWGCENKVDYIAASFVRNTKDLADIRKVLDDHNGKDIRIISKIENTEAVANLDSIIEASDGLMVARGDLGVEVLPEDVPVIQRDMIHKCRVLGKPVITATQMLDSMKNNPNPTRAEVSDVATAVMESTDSVMLSAETASGEYPVEACSMQARIARKMESCIDYQTLGYEAYETSNKTLNDALANAVSNTALLLNASLIVCFSETGSTAKRLSKCRPICPIIEVSNRRAACVSGMMGWGVYPKLVKHVPQFIEEMEVLAIHIAKQHNIKKGSKVIITGGTPVGAGKTNFMKVISIAEKETDIDL